MTLTNIYHALRLTLGSNADGNLPIDMAADHSAAADRTRAAFALIGAAENDLERLRDAAGQMLELMEDAIGIHIYSLEDGDEIPANCGYLASIERVRAALGLIRSGIDSVPVWAYRATFAKANGDPGSYETEVTAADATQAQERGRADLDVMNRNATKVDARVTLIAGTPL